MKGLLVKAFPYSQYNADEPQKEIRPGLLLLLAADCINLSLDVCNIVNSSNIR